MNKKTLLFALLLVGYSNVQAQDDSKALKSERKTNCCSCKKAVSVCQHTLVAINSGLDYLLSTKGALKTAVLAAPLVYLYCLIFKCKPVEAVIKRAITFWGYIKETYKIQEEYGRNQAILSNLANSPKQTFYSAFVTYINKAIQSGVPEIMSMAAKEAISRI